MRWKTKLALLSVVLLCTSAMVATAVGDNLAERAKNAGEVPRSELKPPDGFATWEEADKAAEQGLKPEPTGFDEPMSLWPVEAEGEQGGQEGSRAACVGDKDINGVGTTAWTYMTSTLYHDRRCTTIYLASEFACTEGGQINGIRYYVSTVSGMALTNFTIRMRHTAASAYTTPYCFENTGWTVCYQATTTLNTTGWKTFTFTTPFTYNGTSNLEVDVSFNNASYTGGGAVYSFTGTGNRTKYAYCDSCNADPLNWTCGSPNPTMYGTTSVPRAQFIFPPPEYGACCNGYTCTPNMSQAACVAGGGIYRGNGSSCTPNPCQAACCINFQCYDYSSEECTAGGGTWYLGQSCATFFCPPWNDNCTAVTPVTLDSGVPVMFTGDNRGSTNDCASFAGGQTWHAVTLPVTYAFWDVTLDYCTTAGPFGNAWLNWATGCPCPGFTTAGLFNTTTCGDGNVTIQWPGQAAGTYYYPVMWDPPPAPTAEGPYTLHVVANRGYCDSRATTTADETIKTVVFNTINNTTTDCDRYNNFTSISTDIQVASTYPLSLTIGDCEGTGCYSKWAAVYIDWNQDWDFDDAGETAWTSGQLTGTPCPDMTVTGNITVPVGATLGPTRMRVIVKEVTSTTPPPACGTYSWGATEDYTVNVVPAPPVGACCFAADNCQNPMTQADCETAGGVYQGDGSDCDPNPCGGACCYENGNCTIETPADCATLNGLYQGTGSLCAKSCPQAGACCLPDASCVEEADWACTADGGVFKGVGVECTSVQCPLLIVAFPFDTDPGWTIDAGSEWQFGPPLGLGSVDPTAAHTPPNVYGYDLTGLGAQLGNYEISQPQYNLTSTAINCAGFQNVELRFWRWLRVESATYDHASVQVSNDNTNWTTIWNHTGTTITDTAWTEYTYDINAVAMNEPTVYLRWTMGPTDTSVEYCGWNIDDVSIWAAEIPPMGACCMPPDFATCQDGNMTQAQCEGQGGIYQGNGSVCTPNPCVGACCDTDGTCAVVVETACTGTYQGDGTDCTRIACPQPGACCVDDGTCYPSTVTAPGDCAPGDTYLDDNTVCTPNPCPQPGACCVDDGTCYPSTVTAPGDCAPDDTYLGNNTVCTPNPCPQPGDNCTNPKPLTLSLAGLPVVDSDTTCGRDNDYADTCLGYYDGGEDIIYEVTVTDDMCVKIAVDGALTYVGVAVASTCPPGATCVAFATSSAGDPIITGLNLTAGTYYIMIDTWPSPTCTAYTMTISECVIVWNDNCAGATPVGEGTPAVIGNNCDASATDDAEATCQANSNKDLWYDYLASCSATVTIDTEGSAQSDTVLSVWDACGGTEIACDDDSGTGLLSTLTINAVQGTHYWIRVASYSTYCGGLNLNIACPPQGACCHDGGCTIEYSGACTTMGGTYLGNSVPCGTPDCNGNGVNDACDIVAGAPDCQPNGIPDSCDITAGTSLDCQPDGTPDECQLDAPKAIVISEGFEGTVPPATWSAGVTNPSFTWQIGTYLPPEGVQFADCLYDPALVPQDEWLLTPVLNMFGTVTLTGKTMGSAYWGVTPYDNYDVEAWIVIGDVGGGDDTLIAQLDQDHWVVNWQWEDFSYTFPAPSGAFRIGFRYVGVDGAEAGLDIITVEGSTGLPANDCNTNGIPDDCDILYGTSHDYNHNDIPDECEMCGDIDGDGDVDIDDYWEFVGAFGTCATDPGHCLTHPQTQCWNSSDCPGGEECQFKYNPAANFDGDQCITLVDYQAWLVCYRMANGKDFKLPRPGGPYAPQPQPRPAPRPVDSGGQPVPTTPTPVQPDTAAPRALPQTAP